MLDYQNPLKIQEDANTGLLLLVDDNGKKLARADSPTSLLSVAKSKGVLAGDLPPPTDPRQEKFEKEQLERERVEKESAASNTAESAVADSEKNTTPLNTTISETPSAVVAEKAATTPPPKTLSDKEPNTAKKVEKQKQQEKSTARPNPLFDYANFTYGISLHVVPPENYNKMMTVPGYQYIPIAGNNVGTVLIASGGRRNDSNFKRHPDFNEDFYFKELKMTTVVGLSARTKNTNAIEVSFTIIEPYGITLINRLLSMANNINTNSWMQIPFLLEIDFFGNTSTGEAHNKIIGQTKYIPIKITGCKIKVGKEGSEYQISAVPFNHQAYNDSNVRTPAAFEVTATTVDDFFSSESARAGEAEKIMQVNNAVNDRIEALNKQSTEEEKNKSPNSNRLAEINKAKQQLGQAAQTSSYLVGSYTAAINSFQEQLVNNKKKLQQFPEKYSFVFDDEIKKSKIVFPDKTAINKIAMLDKTSQQAIAEIRSSAGIQTNGFDKTKESFGINAGTSIIDVINQVMRNSEFIRSQLKDTKIDAQTASDSDIESYANKSKKTIKWYKIIPIIEIDKFDLVRDTYSKKITYYVKIYEFFNTKSPNAPIAIPDTALKEYHYMFTGQNQSIIDFSLDFDTMFYTVLTSDNAKLEKTLVLTTPEEDLSGKSKLQKPEVGVQDHAVKFVTGQMDIAASQGTSPDAKSQTVNDFYKASLSDSRGDMINVKLKIIGDPEFIKQDDIFFNPVNTKFDKNAVIDKNGSLIFDAAEIHALLTFRSPIDFDPKTGLANFGGPASTSVFSGMYRVIYVENEFKNGQFTQNLDLIRMFKQEKYDTVSKVSDSSQANRSDAPKTIAESKKDPEDEPLKNAYKIPTKTPTNKETLVKNPIKIPTRSPIPSDSQKLMNELKSVNPIGIGKANNE